MTPTKQPRQKTKPSYHHGDLMAAIRSTALKFIAARGSVEFTMRELSADIGVTHGALYSHFNNKQALLEDLAVTSLQTLQNEQQQSIQSCEHSLEKLHRLAWTYTVFARSNPGAYRLIFNSNEPSRESAVVVMARTSATALIVAAISEAQREKFIVEGSINLLAFTLWSATHGLSHLLLSEHVSPFDEVAKDVDRTIGYALTRFFYGVATARGRKWLDSHVSEEML
ncbi:MAG: TetR/AcrR family transcriptional regulator [Gammaproteobacteria bacterium]|nr:TetR/AcrR family transcriptional regulator [Gammaproteobacteria bacterium]